MTVHFSTSNFNWDDARIFLAAYRAGSLLGAAQELGVSHSTVRRRIASLEHTFGTKLFSATSEGLVPTDSAQTAFAAAEQIESAAAQFGDRLTGQARDLQGSLVVTTIDALAEFMAPIIASYTAQYPNVAVTLNTENRYLDLARRESDIAIRLTNTPDERLFGRKVGTVQFAPFAHQSLIERHGTDMGSMPWILWDQSAGAIGTENWYKNISSGKNPIARVTNTMSLLSMVRSGIGAAVLAEPIAHLAGFSPLASAIEGFDTDLWCLCHPEFKHSQRVRSFMDEVIRQGIVIGDVKMPTPSGTG